MAGVTGVLGGHEGPLALACDQAPALVGLEVVVELAQPVQQLKDGDVGLGQSARWSVWQYWLRTPQPSTAQLG